MRKQPVRFLGLILVLGALMGTVAYFVISWAPLPKDEPKPTRELQQRPDPLISVQFLRETDVRDEGLTVSSWGDAIPYASTLVRERAESLVDREVYIKMLMYDIIEGGEHQGIELRVQDVADRRLLDDVAKKVGERRGLRTVMAGWERYGRCKILAHNMMKNMLTLETSDGTEITGSIFDPVPPTGTFVRAITVDASHSFENGVMYFTGIVSVEAVKE